MPMAPIRMSDFPMVGVSGPHPAATHGGLVEPHPPPNSITCGPSVPRGSAIAAHHLLGAQGASQASRGGLADDQCAAVMAEGLLGEACGFVVNGRRGKAVDKGRQR